MNNLDRFAYSVGAFLGRVCATVWYWSSLHKLRRDIWQAELTRIGLRLRFKEGVLDYWDEPDFVKHKKQKPTWFSSLKYAWNIGRDNE